MIPLVSVRQRVLSRPIPMRVLPAAQPKLVTPVLQALQRVGMRHLCDAAGLGANGGHGGAVALIRRFGLVASGHHPSQRLRPRAGQKVRTLRGAMPRETAVRPRLCADIDGFSLHAAARVEAIDRKRLEQLYRHITRPALSDERGQLNAAGQGELELKTSWRDGTTHLVMCPREFMRRLAVLVPWPRLHLNTFHGVLAPNAKLRVLVVPEVPPEQERAAN